MCPLLTSESFNVSKKYRDRFISVNVDFMKLGWNEFTLLKIRIFEIFKDLINIFKDLINIFKDLIKI